MPEENPEGNPAPVPLLGIIGRIEPYDESVEPWTSYVERLEQYFEVNNITESKKVPALLTLLGGKTYGLLRNLTAPAKPKEKTFDVIVKLLTDHMTPKPIVIAERFRFHKRNQKDGESINDYMAELRKLTEYCDFGLVLNDTLRDRLVCGLLNEQIQKKLLTVADLNLTKAIEIAVAMETASKDAIELRNASGTSTPVHKMRARNRRKPQVPAQNQPSRKKPLECYRCKGPHTADVCRFKNAYCNNCKKKGHIQAACQGKKRNPPDTRNVHSLDDQPDHNSDDCGIYSVSANGNKAIIIKPLVDNVELSMELDTGSAVSCISNVDYVKYFSGKPLNKSSVILKTYSGEKIIPNGVINVNVQHNGQSAKLDLFVVQKGGPPLFGREWLRHFQLNWKEIKSLKVEDSKSSNPKLVKLANGYQKSNPELRKLLIQYEDLFQDGIGLVTCKEASLSVKPDSVPKFVKARPIPFAMRSKVEAELDKLEKDGIISKVDFSDWASPIVPVLKKDGSVRICGDFKVTVNPVLQVD